MSRYERQEILPEIGAKGQARIRSAELLVIGAGGLGVPLLQYLVGAGIGRITLVDPDSVEVSNLHRQPIYAEHIGAAKAQAAADFLQRLNPDVAITPIVDHLTPANAPELIAAADLVVDCADSFAVSYTLSDLCLAQHKPLISASVLGTSGYVGGFCGGAPSLRAVFPDLPDHQATCASAGVLGPLVGMFGLIQAQMALAIILGAKPSPLGLLWHYEMAGFRSTSFRFDQAPEPLAPFPFIAKSDLRESDLIIDLRSESEAPTPVAPKALRLPIKDFGANGPTPARSQRAIFVCRSGLRAWRAADQLRRYWSGDIALLADIASPQGGTS